MSGRHRKSATRRGSGRHRRAPAHAPWIAPALVSLLVLGAGGITAYAALTARTSDGPARPAPIADAAGPTAPAPAPSLPTPTAHRPPPTTRQPEPALALTITGRVSWIEVTRTNGRALFSGLLRHGRRLVYPTGGLRLVIGNAGAVRLVRHGRVTAPAGRPGQVVRTFVR
jgi:hypothetical protein